MKKIYPLITRGSSGRLVEIAQMLLIKAGCLAEKAEDGKSNVDGKFGTLSVDAAKAFQRSLGFDEKDIDGKIGKMTWPALLEIEPTFEVEVVILFPEKPPFKALSSREREELFGTFAYSPRTAQKPGQSIEILDDWENRNIEKFYIPQLDGVPLYDVDNNQRCSGFIRLHRLAGPIFQRFFDRVELLGYRKLIMTYDGAFNPRFIRDSRTNLSNHSWGTALDINAFANGLGFAPARLGEPGYLLPLVPIARECGIYWGGHFSRPDPMHFEIAKL